MIDGGVVAEPEVVRITEEQWAAAEWDEIESLRDIHVYPNQQYMLEREFPSGDLVVKLRYSTPCITSLEE